MFQEVYNIKGFSFHVPFLKTHTCLRCRDEETNVSDIFFDKVQLLYILGERNNFFERRNQICPKK